MGLVGLVSGSMVGQHAVALVRGYAYVTFLRQPVSPGMARREAGLGSTMRETMRDMPLSDIPGGKREPR